MPAPPVALSIAGFDPSSGAGVTADLAVFAAHGVFGTSAITVLTAQSTRGVAGTSPIDASFLAQTLAYLTDDLPPQGIKLGAMGTLENATVAGRQVRYLLEHSVGKTQIPIVFDPVLTSSSGTSLLPAEAIPSLHEVLLPYVSWITPNWDELALLTGREVLNLSQAECAADTLAEAHPHLTIIVTGGDQEQPTDLLRTIDGTFSHVEGERIETTSTHGTGCAFSAALLSQLMRGKSPLLAATAAKHFVREALLRAPGLGGGRGPLDLIWPLERQEAVLDLAGMEAVPAFDGTLPS